VRDSTFGRSQRRLNVRSREARHHLAGGGHVLGALVCVAILLALLPGCSGDSAPSGPDGGGVSVPQFVDANYINLDKIYRISKFRSGVGHDYSDQFESCRSMKHYSQPKGDLDWSSVEVFSPVTGTVTDVSEGWAGWALEIGSQEQPDFTFILGHVNLTIAVSVGDTVEAGQQVGTNIGEVSTSEIVVGITTSVGWRLISYFDVLTDAAFQEYQARGVGSREELVISEAQRDADPLTCDGEEFEDGGNLENWVYLGEDRSARVEER
jgi:hypothetical protein